MGPQEDLTAKGEAEWAWPILGRPPLSAGHGSAPPTYPLSVKLPGSSLKSVHDASLPFHSAKASFSPLINMRGGGKNRDTQQLHLSLTFRVKGRLGVEGTQEGRRNVGALLQLVPLRE